MRVRELFRNYVVEERAPTRRGSLNLRYRDIALFFGLTVRSSI